MHAVIAVVHQHSFGPDHRGFRLICACGERGGWHDDLEAAVEEHVIHRLDAGKP